jgi:flagellar basal-body rod modification protein FlgD
VGTDTFLQLLVAQLKYQDPLEPQTDTAFVTQLAQMTSLEQMQQMNASLSSAKAYDMLGKVVYAEVLDSDTGITDSYLGKAESVVIKDGIPYVVIGSTAVAVSDVLQIYDALALETGTTALETGTTASETGTTASETGTDTV